MLLCTIYHSSLEILSLLDFWYSCLPFHLQSPKNCFYPFLNFVLLLFPQYNFFSTIQHGDPVTHTCIHSFFLYIFFQSLNYTGLSLINLSLSLFHSSSSPAQYPWKNLKYSPGFHSIYMPMILKLKSNFLLFLRPRFIFFLLSTTYLHVDIVHICIIHILIFQP